MHGLKGHKSQLQKDSLRDIKPMSSYSIISFHTNLSNMGRRLCLPTLALTQGEDEVEGR